MMQLKFTRKCVNTLGRKLRFRPEIVMAVYVFLLQQQQQQTTKTLLLLL